MDKRSRRDFLKHAGAFTALPVAGAMLGCGDGGSESGITTQDVFTDAGTDVEATIPDTETPEPLPEYEYDGPLGPETIFEHGVASGDPLAYGVILWTRVSVESQVQSVEVWWEIAADEAFEQRLAVGTAATNEDQDFTVKLDATELSPATTYFYRFFALGRQSPVGRTRTAPDGAADKITFGVCSCANLPRGYFHSYRRLAERDDLDAVLHLGDYFYEYEMTGFVAERSHEPASEIITLDDYRTRFSQYRRDIDLQEAHRRHPFIAVWDDHESANNSYKDGAQNHTEGSEGVWANRKAAAQQAYSEWMPIRSEDPSRIFRRLKYGNLLDLIMLDTRLFGRDPQSANPSVINQLERTILGEEQELWLTDQLVESTAIWRILGQQVVISPVLAGGTVVNPDQWDGYPEARKRLLTAIVENDINGVVVLTGDIHSSWAAEVPLDTKTYDAKTGEGAVAIEFVTPGVTSGFPLDVGLADIAKALNPHIKYGEVTNKGYMVLEVTEELVQNTWYHFSNVQDEGAQEKIGAVFSSLVGSNRLLEEEIPAGNL
jgi:alkaline phosphatase D